MEYSLSNAHISIKINSLGAELCSLVAHQTEYLWQADPLYWKRHSPVLFPIVGNVYQNEYRVNGQTYHLSQHGFARDREFELVEQSEDTIRFRLRSDEESLQKYPFAFELEIGYKLIANKVKVLWTVRNTGNGNMPFQIGAHPAFYYPDFQAEDEVKGFFGFDTQELSYILIKNGGADTAHRYQLATKEALPLTNNLFAEDALIVENGQVHSVCLMDKEKQPWLTVHFDAPVVGLWSPPQKNAPFVCIEPWYGRCDESGYKGEFADKEWMQKLAAGEQFHASYIIEIANR